jgi:hypothetical protein
MILNSSQSKEWINKFRTQKRYAGINPPICEKMVYAFILLEKLKESGLDFVFKGGTSLILLLPDFDRFSVDIDIVTSTDREEIIRKLQWVVDNSIFKQFTIDERRANAGGIPKSHYAFSYDSELNLHGNILLDVLHEKNDYPETIELEIRNQWIETSEPYLKVKTPCINSMLGDKLTAFAPNTTGVPYNKNKSLEIIKQLHDISKLIDFANDLHIVKLSFSTIANRQIQYRNLSVSLFDICDDIFDTAILIAKREKNKDLDSKNKFDELQKGIKQFGNFLMYNNFRIEDAITASAKAALLATKIKYNSISEIQLFHDEIDVSKLEILNPEYNFLNRFKKTLKPAFYYWYQCFIHLQN